MDGEQLFIQGDVKSECKGWDDQAKFCGKREEKDT